MRARLITIDISDRLIFLRKTQGCNTTLVLTTIHMYVADTAVTSASEPQALFSIVWMSLSVRGHELKLHGLHAIVHTGF